MILSGEGAFELFDIDTKTLKSQNNLSIRHKAEIFYNLLTNLLIIAHDLYNKMNIIAK